MKLEFELEEKSRANNLYLQLNFCGGDADTEHPEMELLPFGFDVWENHINEIEIEIKKYKLLSEILDVNSAGYMGEDDYDDIKEKHGEVIADLFDNVPNDPQCDYQYKCYLDSPNLIGYDESGNKYESVIDGWYKIEV